MIKLLPCINRIPTQQVCSVSIGVASATEAGAYRQTTIGPVIVACDGTAADDSVLVSATTAARALAADIEVLGVCSPAADYASEAQLLSEASALDEIRRKSMLEEVRRFISAAAAGDTNWPVSVSIGAPPRTLAHEARLHSASLIVMGIGRHNPLDRLFGTDITLATIRESFVPVLAVAESLSIVTTAVVGVDFSAASIRAAEYAIKLLEGRGKLSLVHVRPLLGEPSGEWKKLDVEYGRKLPYLFDSFLDNLNVPLGVAIETVTLRGDPARMLPTFAQRSNANIIAVGTQRQVPTERLAVGSVATRVLRTSRCSVLAVPAKLGGTVLQASGY